jgi:hypothetical protein
MCAPVRAGTFVGRGHHDGVEKGARFVGALPISQREDLSNQQYSSALKPNQIDSYRNTPLSFFLSNSKIILQSKTIQSEVVTKKTKAKKPEELKKEPKANL